MPVGEDLDLPVTLPHGGANVLQFSVAPVEGELTDRNNATAIQVNGVRDRLRVLLVTGKPQLEIMELFRLLDAREISPNAAAEALELTVDELFSFKEMSM